ncbi:PGF-CTERM sorting domain-containing protein [Halorarius litoreus]|uniref:PGF-CTERM sorting domain-containing protein n=1 Tax=Halorarius litoreus TaxID=2962676 RepID=UPI0025757DA1|nr:PGF-CTERM sorting domain-containing protein [Halorarius litoreus]
MDRLRPTLLVCVLAVALLLAAAPAGADHGSPSNFTVVAHDTEPGIDDATYEQHATAPITIEYLDYIGASWEEGGFTGCGPANSDTFGIDRGNDDPGTTTDEGLAQYVEESKVDGDQFVADFYEEDDAFGSSTNLARGDEFVSVTTNCFDNPSEPGWYQIHSSIGGTAPNGSYVEATDISHYFYVCECANEKQARQQLGPPPSAATPTPTASPTPTAEPTPTRTPPAEGTPFPSPTPTATPKQSTPTPVPATAESAASTSAPDSGSGGSAGASDGGSGATAAGSPTPTSEDWASYVRETPTVGSGPGFGGVVALAALVAAALLALRRR